MSATIEDVLILAVTKMEGGVCIAGVNQRHKWLRPVLAFKQLAQSDITYRDGTLMQPFDVVPMPVVQRRGRSPHVEDAVVDFSHYLQPARRLTGDKRAAWLDRYAEDGHAAAAAIYERYERSLALVRTPQAEAVVAYSPKRGRLELRIAADFLWQGSLPCTDLRWRAFSHRLLATSEMQEGEQHDLHALLGVEQIYLTLGLSRPQHKEQCWSLIVGVHTVPEFAGIIDLHSI